MRKVRSVPETLLVRAGKDFSLPTVTEDKVIMALSLQRIKLISHRSCAVNAKYLLADI